MTLKNIQASYKDFIEQYAIAHYTLSDLVPTISKFLSDYCKERNYDEVFADDLDINLLYLEKILQDLEEHFEYFEKISLLALKQPIRKNKIIKRQKYKDSDEILYVDLNHPLDWQKL